MNQKNKLIWKYFLQQKVIEISVTILIISAIVFIPYLLGHFIGDDDYCNTKEFIINQYTNNQISEVRVLDPVVCNIGQWFEGIAYTIIGLLSLFCVLLIFALIDYWLDYNWKKAKKRAEKKLKKDKEYGKK